MYVLNLENFVWKKLGVTNNLIRSNASIKGAKRFFKFNEKLLFSYTDTPEFFIADFNENIVEKFKDDALFYKSSGHSIIKKNNLIGAVQNSLTGDVRIESFNLSSLLDQNTNNELYLYRDTEGFYRYIYFALSFLALLIIALSLYYKKVAQTYLLDEKSISISGSLLLLSEIEQKTLSLFSKKRFVSNNELMSLFIEQNKTKDFAVKKKNKTIQMLNEKLFSDFRIMFINKQKSKSDSRQLTYFLNKKVRIVDESTI